LSKEFGTYPVWHVAQTVLSLIPKAASCAEWPPTLGHGSPEFVVPVELWQVLHPTVAEAYHACGSTL
jgi:hypothetical protein